MARVNEGSHSFTCHPHVYPQVEWTMPAFTPQPQSITALWLVLTSRPAEGRRLSWPGWLGEILRFFARRRLTHPGTNRARRGVTSLIRPTTLPLSHAANLHHNTNYITASGVGPTQNLNFWGYKCNSCRLPGWELVPLSVLSHWGTMRGNFGV